MSVLSKDQVEDRLVLVAENRATAVAQREILASHESLRSALAASEAEVARVAKELEATKRVTWCAYCGETFPLDTVTAEQVGEHIRTCPRHPMRAVEAALTAAVEAREKATTENDDLRARLCSIIGAANGDDGPPMDEWSLEDPLADVKVLRAACVRAESERDSARDGEKRAREALARVDRVLVMAEVGNDPIAKVRVMVGRIVEAALSPTPESPPTTKEKCPKCRAFDRDAEPCRRCVYRDANCEDREFTPRAPTPEAKGCAECDRYRTALEKICHQWEVFVHDHDTPGVTMARVSRIAEEALTAPPTPPPTRAETTEAVDLLCGVNASFDGKGLVTISVEDFNRLVGESRILAAQGKGLAWVPDFRRGYRACVDDAVKAVEQSGLQWSGMMNHRREVIAAILALVKP